MWLWILGIATSALAFLLGRVWAQTEKVLEEKRAAYIKFLDACPTARDAYRADSRERLEEAHDKFDKMIGQLSLYADIRVIDACGKYFESLHMAASILGPDSPALHPVYKQATTLYNSMVLEMRRDLLAWSAYAMPRVKRELKAIESRVAANPRG